MLVNSSSNDHAKPPVICSPLCLVDVIAVSIFGLPGVGSRQTADLGRHPVATAGRQLLGSLDLTVSIAPCDPQEQSHHRRSSSHRTLFRNLYEVSLVNCDSLSTLTEAQRLMSVSSSCPLLRMDLLFGTCSTCRVLKVKILQSAALGNRTRYNVGTQNLKWRFAGGLCCG